MSAIEAQVPRNELRVMVAVATHDQCSAGFAHDLAMLVGQMSYNRPDVELRLSFNKGTILSALREGLVFDAMENECTHICFIDSDMRFPPDAIHRLLNHGEPVVGANYITRRFPLKPTAYVSETEPLWTEPGAQGVVEVARMGLGLALFDMSVFEYLPQPWFSIPFVEKQFGDRTFKFYVTEDYSLCDKIRTAGVRVLVDQGLSQHIRHEGSWEYSHEHALAQRDAIQFAEANSASDRDNGQGDAPLSDRVLAQSE